MPNSKPPTPSPWGLRTAVNDSGWAQHLTTNLMPPAMRVVLCICVPRQHEQIKLRKEIKLIKEAASSAEAIRGLIILISLIGFTSAMAWVPAIAGDSARLDDIGLGRLLTSQTLGRQKHHWSSKGAALDRRSLTCTIS